MKDGILKNLSLSGSITCLVLMVPSVILSRRLDAAVSRSAGTGIALEAFPKQLGDWRGEETARLDARSREILRLDEYLRRVYRTPDGRSVFVYVGYWRRQSGEHQAGKHSPLMCFPANGLTISPPEERVLASTRLPSGRTKEVRQSGGPAEGASFAVSRLLASDKDLSSVYYYWFFSGSETYRDETFALLHVIRGTLLEGRSDGGIVEMSVDLPKGSASADVQQEAEKTLREFAEVFVPALESLIDAGSTSRG